MNHGSEAREFLLEVINLHKSFGDTEVLRGLNLKVRKGEVIVVIGPSGSGKSTWLRCINRLEDFQRGEIRVSGQSVLDPNLKLRELRAEIGTSTCFFTLRHYRISPWLQMWQTLREQAEREALKPGKGFYLIS
jgi:ABC-type polar amino acid transport system ATPase subunit